MAKTAEKKAADSPERGSALAIVETRGLTGAIEAADAMVKTADVRVTHRVRPDGGLVDVFARGEIGSVQAAAEAGAEAARRAGELVGVHVIARPHASLEAMLGPAGPF